MRNWARILAVGAVVGLGAACVKDPTMRLNHAEITGVSIGLPPSLGILMTVYVDVYNPNSYDVAVRAVRGQVLLARRYSLPVNYQAPGEGAWLRAGTTTTVTVPVDVPVQIGMAVLAEYAMTPTIPYHFTGRADVTAGRTLRLETDDYSVNADGFVARQQIATVLGQK
jgi:hypothetical protein